MGAAIDDDAATAARHHCGGIFAGLALCLITLVGMETGRFGARSFANWRVPRRCLGAQA
jgi:hypothetical protein